MIHQTHKYLINPVHKISVNLIGVGGTGSRLLSNLVTLHNGLVAKGHPGLHVVAWDDDLVSEANISRQAFYPTDIGKSKSIVLVERINRFLGTGWLAMPQRFNLSQSANITIICVDTLSSRQNIYKFLNGPASNTDRTEPLYVLDIGNDLDYGQYVLGTISDFEKSNRLPTLFNLHPSLKYKKDKKNSPSCSLKEAMEKQDLFVNQFMALHATQLLWRLFTAGQIDYHGGYVNLKTMQHNLIKTK